MKQPLNLATHFAMLLMALAMAFTFLACEKKDDGNTFTDARDGKKYKFVKIGEQTWMAENLNYKTETSLCHDDDENNCKKYGRLYVWKTAKSACPSGWHLPSTSDLDILMNYVQTDNGSFYTSGSEASMAGKYLKAASGWDKNGNGEDKYGFAALPGRYGTSDDVLYSYWWSNSKHDSEHDNYYAYSWSMGYDHERAGWGLSDEDDRLSIRCVED